MNYQEEQNSELEALQSIYPVELNVISNEFPASFSISTKCEDFDDDDADSVACTLFINYTPKYPDEAPELSLDDCTDNLTENGDDDVEEILEKLKSVANENSGMVMCFLLVSALQEELNAIRDKFKQIRVDEANREKREREEAERKRTEGTAVTVESFLAWKHKFDEERRILRQKQGLIISEKNLRPTGKEQFLKDANLATSDIRIIEESGEEVKIDETLFDEFDLDEDIEDADAEGDDDEDTEN